ncbi:MAG: hypothetical protein AB7V47_07615 [Phycisphaerales bacterium]
MLSRLTGAGARIAPVTPAQPIRPGARPESSATIAPGGIDFARLLAKARAGELSSDRLVTVDDGVGVEFSPEQLERLAAAADRAEAEGFATAVVSIDGMNFVLDVASRRITRRVDEGAPVASGIDGVVFVPPASATGLSGANAQAPASGDLGAATRLVAALAPSAPPAWAPAGAPNTREPGFEGTRG